MSIDLNTVRFNAQSYQNLVDSTNCRDLEIHIYNFIEQKHCKLPFYNGEILHKYSGSRKKIALDIKQALDIVELCTKNFYQNVFILCGEYESECLFSKLSEMGVPHKKISLTNYRQTDLSNTETQHCDIKDIEQTKIYAESKLENIDDTQSKKLVASDNNLQAEDCQNNTAINSQINESKIIPFERMETTAQMDDDSNQTKTKLTIDQIKKIYNYIKSKQMENKLKSVQ